MTYRRLFPRDALFLVFCSCHRRNAASGTATIPVLVREGWFRVR